MNKIIQQKPFNIPEFLKTTTSLKCLRNAAETWDLTDDQRRNFGTRMITVNTAIEVWSSLDESLLDKDILKFGEATITSEILTLNYNEYRVLTQLDLFPDIDFTLEKNLLNAIRRFIEEVNRLNNIPNGKRYYIPGFDYMYFVHYEPDNFPEFMKDGS